MSAACGRARHEDRGVELLEVALDVPVERALVVLGDLEHEVSAAAHPRQMLELLQQKPTDPAPLIHVGTQREGQKAQRDR